MFINFIYLLKYTNLKAFQLENIIKESTDFKSDLNTKYANVYFWLNYATLRFIKQIN